MVKLNRRQLLLTGLATGVTTSLTVDHVLRQNARQRTEALEAIAEAQIDTDSLLEAAFQQDGVTINELSAIRASIHPVAQTVPYSREMSKLLILCNKLSTQQYIKGKIDPNYDGSIQSLPLFDDRLAGYTQIASFRGQEAQEVEDVEITRPADMPLSDVQKQLDNHLDQAEASIENTIQEVVKLRRTIPVYYGFVLESEQNSLVFFRGTQRRNEWLENIIALHEKYENQANADFNGQVHVGFAALYQGLTDPLPLKVFRQLNPAKPCYVSGHSLGGAIATLAALDAALNIPQFRPQIQLYTYASPRVGDVDFVNTYHQIIPNSFRIVNLADIVPLVPPTQLNGIYAHVGQRWAFLSQHDDMLPNHQIDTYRYAIDRESEQQDAATYPDLTT